MNVIKVSTARFLLRLASSVPPCRAAGIIAPGGPPKQRSGAQSDRVGTHEVLKPLIARRGVDKAKRLADSPG